jgi:glycosyltransferase involved in cell wall biosynthesis
MLEMQNIQLLIVGDGPDKPMIENKALELGIHRKVVFAGYQSDPHKFYDMMDVLCIPSSREGFGLVAVEAMLHKLPVIATQVGGLQKVVKHNETGFIVPVYSPELMARQLEILLSDKDLRISMGEAGYHRALEKYSADRYCQQIENLYLGTLKEKGKFYS